MSPEFEASDEPDCFLYLSISSQGLTNTAADFTQVEGFVHRLRLKLRIIYPLVFLEGKKKPVGGLAGLIIDFPVRGGSAF